MCIKANDVCHTAFMARGWEWGGDWTNDVVDYQHFEKREIRALYGY